MQEKSLIKQNILQFIDTKGISKYKFYQKTGITRGVLDQNNGMSEENTTRFLACFPEVNPEWLITGQGEMLKKDQAVIIKESKPNYDNKSIPLLPLEAFAGLGESSVAGVDFDTIEERYDVPLFYNIRVDFMINVRGSSMYPKYSSGDVVACRMVDNLLFVQWNKIYVLDTISQGIIMKRLKKSKIKGNIICKSDNHEYEEFEVPMSDIRNIALVVGSIRLE